MAQSAIFFYQDIAGYHDKSARKHLSAASLPALWMVRDGLFLSERWEAEALHEVIMATAEQLGLKLGKVAQPIRVAVSGGPVSPPIDITLELLGRDRVLERLDRAIHHAEHAASEGVA